MVLRDGETAILGGLIRSDENHSKLKLPGLADIPLIGGLFTTAIDDTDDSTDVLLTITPRVIRSWDLVGKDLREIYSGTESNMSSEPSYTSQKDGQARAGKPGKSVNTTTSQQNDSTGTTVTTAVVDATPTTFTSHEVLCSFSDEQYIIQSGQMGDVGVFAENISGIKELSISIAFNPDYVKYLQSMQALGNMTSVENKAGEGILVLNFMFDGTNNADAKTKLADINFSALKPGVSYLVYLETKAKDKDGNEINVQKTASRLVVK
jgi:general secretion pathway protein D